MFANEPSTPTRAAARAVLDATATEFADHLDGDGRLSADGTRRLLYSLKALRKDVNDIRVDSESTSLQLRELKDSTEATGKLVKDMTDTLSTLSSDVRDVQGIRSDIKKLSDKLDTKSWPEIMAHEDAASAPMPSIFLPAFVNTLFFADSNGYRIQPYFRQMKGHIFHVRTRGFAEAVENVSRVACNAGNLAPSVLAFLVGTNDVSSSQTTAWFKERISALCEACKRFPEAKIVILPPPPRSDSPEFMAQTTQLIDLIRDALPDDWIYGEVPELFEGDVKAFLIKDGKHLNPEGAAVYGDKIALILDEYVVRPSFRGRSSDFVHRTRGRGFRGRGHNAAPADQYHHHYNQPFRRAGGFRWQGRGRARGGLLAPPRIPHSQPDDYA
jgi:hypothetical protein